MEKNSRNLQENLEEQETLWFLPGKRDGFPVFVPGAWWFSITMNGKNQPTYAGLLFGQSPHSTATVGW